MQNPSSLAALLAPAGRATAAFYAALFSMLGAYMPFWPLWLEDWGLSPAEVGLWLGLSLALRIGFGLVSPLLADLTGRRRSALALIAASGAAVFLAHGLAESRALLLALTLASGLALSGAIPIGDALAAAAARRHGFLYAQVRAIGSGAFLLANLGCGWAAAALGPEAIRWWIILSFAALIVVSLRHPGGARDSAAARAGLGVALPALAQRAVLLATLASAAVQASHATLYAYGSIQWRAQGIGEGAIGALWAWGVAVETAAMFAFGGWIVARLGPARLLALGAAAALARWGWMTQAPTGPALWAAQALHALTFAPAHLAMIAFIADRLPARIGATAQGAVGAASGVAMAAATFAAAPLYAAFGAGAFWLSAALSACGLAAALALSGADRDRPPLPPPPRREG